MTGLYQHRDGKLYLQPEVTIWTFEPLGDDDDAMPTEALDALPALTAALMDMHGGSVESTGRGYDDTVLFKCGVVRLPGDTIVGYHLDVENDSKITFAVGTPQ